MAARASGGNICDKVAPNSGDNISAGLTVVFAIPLSALNHSPVPVTLGKYLVNASLRCCWAASMSKRAVRMAMLCCRAESRICCSV